jgi:protein-S-isoprenylcysteine O-methyltransferase Ste14
VLSYLIFLGVFLYAMGWVGNYVVPKGIDDGPETATGVAIAVNVALLGLFGVQHSIMARPAFKRVITKYVPQPAERATYCLASSACLILMFFAWRPMPVEVWNLMGTPWEWVMRRRICTSMCGTRCTSAGSSRSGQRR